MQQPIREQKELRKGRKITQVTVFEIRLANNIGGKETKIQRK